MSGLSLNFPMRVLIQIGIIAAVAGSQAVASAQWSRVSDCIPRITNTQAQAFNDQIVLVGHGIISVNGRQWTDLGDDLATSGDNASVVFADKLWSFGGGWDPQNATADVWYSSDGLTWHEPSRYYEAPWGVRTKLAAVAFGGYMWVMGGVRQAYVEAPEVYLKDVWRSTDGENWELVTDNPGWAPRAYLRSAVFQEKIWIVGGLKEVGMGGTANLNDVWYSEDGATWVEAVANAPWPARSQHTVTVHEDKLWVIGGWGKEYFSDVWYSSDGINWNQHTEAAPWKGRYSHAAVSFNGDLLVIGGGIMSAYTHESIYRDVWALTTTPSPEEPLVWHSADQDQDQAISLSELLRVVQFYNFRKADTAFHCDCDSEDGYNPQGGVTSCEPHTSDYSPQDWHIELNELLRLIQFFNGGGYHACPDAASEDGFCVGAG